MFVFYFSFIYIDDNNNIEYLGFIFKIKYFICINGRDVWFIGNIDFMWFMLFGLVY